MARRALKAHLISALPKLGWVASIPLVAGDVTVLHGDAVEHTDEWVVEGVWDAPFEQGDFHKSEAFFGSGLRIDGEEVVACASTALVDRLLYYVTADRLIVSNSLLILLAVSGSRLDVAHDYSPDCRASMWGIFQQPRLFHVEHSSVIAFSQLYHGNLIVSGGVSSVQLRTTRHRISSFEEYVTSLRSILKRIWSNYKSTGRRIPLSAYTTVSSGYDSAATSCLVKELGVTECFTTSPARTVDGPDALEDGAAIAVALGLHPHRLVPPSEEVSPDEAYFIAPSVWGSELIFHSMAKQIETRAGVSILFTGYHGDKVWDIHTSGLYLADDIRRGDSSGLNLSEIRLKSGFVNVAVPFLFARSIQDLVQLARSEAMAPWRTDTGYDRPIPRRIIESAGVPRELFGQRKRAVWGYYNYPFNLELRRAFIEWLDARFGFGRVRVSAYEMVSAIDWRLAQTATTLGMGGHAAAVPRALKRLIFQGQDLRHLMFKWAGNHLCDRLAQQLGRNPF